jgi:hypothetical protein
VGGRRALCAIIIHGWVIIVICGWGIVIPGWGLLLSVGGHRGIVVVCGHSLFGVGGCLHAQSLSIGGGVIVIHVVSFLSVGESVSVVRIGMGGSPMDDK